MRHVEVLGFECAACRKTLQRIEATALELDVVIRLEKVSDPARIAAYRVLSVPGVAVAARCHVTVTMRCARTDMLPVARAGPTGC